MSFSTVDASWPVDDASISLAITFSPFVVQQK